MSTMNFSSSALKVSLKMLERLLECQSLRQECATIYVVHWTGSTRLEEIGEKLIDIAEK
jgi:hypothetical protein